MPIRKIMLIRHAEKPAIDGTDVGVDEFGQPHAKALSVRGWERAGALVRFFAPQRGQNHASNIATPHAIYAAAARNADDSDRPRQTVGPLARALDIEVRLAFHKSQADELVSELMSADFGIALVCWEHRVLPDIAARLCPTKQVPNQWPDDRFDMVWILDRKARGFVFSQTAQLLLPRDTDGPI